MCRQKSGRQLKQIMQGRVMGSVCSKLVQLMLSKVGGAVNINNTIVIDFDHHYA